MKGKYLNIKLGNAFYLLVFCY